MTRTVCIVDAFSTGADLPWRFKKAGFRVVHLHSNFKAPDLELSFDGNDIDINYYENEFVDVNHLLQIVKTENPTMIIAGTETGIILADKLSDHLNLLGNDKFSSSHRRNKTLMQQSLQRENLKFIKGITTNGTNLTEALVTKKVGYPCVVKPEESAGADNVYFCDNFEEVKLSSNKIIGHKNKIGGFNKNALIQENVIGQQYYVNALSLEGKHRVTEIWEDNKIHTSKGRVVCDREVLLDGHGTLQNEIRNYIYAALDALKIRNGASHSELMFTEDGPVLIETAARMQGTILPKAVEKALGYSHPSLLFNFVHQPQDWFFRIPEIYNRKFHLNVVTLISKHTGIIIKSNLFELLETLPSFVGVIHTPCEGDLLRKTIDLFTNPGTIYLCSDDEQNINEDYKKIRYWEKENAFFVIAK